MCGINGVFGLDRITDPKKVIQDMNARLGHRGPDAEGIYRNDRLVLGHKRLSIIDLDKRSDQPMTDASGRYTIVYNGEVYNFREIRNWLKDYPFVTDSDTETVLAAYAKWGSDCLSRFNGMFAFAIWDNVEQRLFLARDRMGIKPLYYYIGNDSVVFSSEIRALLASGQVPAQIDPYGLTDYLRYQIVHAPNTMLRGVLMLRAGHYMTITDSDQNTVKYWSPETTYSEKASGMSLVDVHAEIRDRFSRAVSRRLISDVAFGGFLSGGIDSSAVVSMMAEHSDKVSTFNVSFEEPEFSESRFARIIAKKYGTDHHEIVLRPDDFLKTLPEALSAMDHPSGDGPNTYVVSRAVKQAGISMALSGLGGDELFAGYDVFKRTAKLYNNKWFMSFAPNFRAMAAKPIKWIKRSASGDKLHDLLMLDYWDIEHSYPLSRKVLRNSVIAELLYTTDLPPNQVHAIVKDHLAYGTSGFNLPLLSKVSVAEMTTYMENVLLQDTDQMSMAHALEVRVPFLDHELVEFVLGVPDTFKFPHSSKKLLVDALGEKLPLEVVNRPKMGFTFPWEVWLKNELRDWTITHLESMANRPTFDRKTIMGLLKAFESGSKRVTWSRIWYLAVLEHWLKAHNIDA